MTAEMMQRDIRHTALYREAEALAAALRRPGTGEICDAAELHASADGKEAVFVGTLLDALVGAPPTRICRVDLASGEIHVLTFGPNSDRSPKYAPDARRLAFLSDRQRAGDFQLFLWERASGAAHAAPQLPGWVEYLQWSPDGRRILLGVAGHGADRTTAQGATASQRVGEGAASSWAPVVAVGDEACHWRRAWIFDVTTGSMRQVSSDEMNVWEAAWCSNGQLVALASAGPSENLWYGARLELLDLESCSSVEIYRPRNQLGCLAASSSGTHIAVVEALCSDRGIVAGDLLLIERASGSTRRVDTRRVDVSHVEWRSETRLLVAGLRGIDTVVASYDVATGEFEELWVSGAISATGTNIAVAGIGERDCAFIAEGFVRAPEIGVIEAGVYRTVRSLAAGYARYAASIEAVQRVVWRAQDGVEIEGLLLRPRVRPPYPTVMNIHGGPVWHWRSRWLGRGAAPMLMLLARGYAILLPNPRGSSGRGQEFARAVVGDLGGVDAQDLLAAIDQLTLEGLVDPRRLGVIGGSYGGYLTAWLITQDTRFAAAVPLAPITHHASFYLTSNIPHFLRLFLAGSYDEPGGRYFQRSPIAHAHRVRTPTLSVCGGLDRCTPPTEALQFHCALVEHGVESALLTYSEEGHGIRKFPATIDCAARIVAWFERHMPAASPGGSQA